MSFLCPWIYVNGISQVIFSFCSVQLHEVPLTFIHATMHSSCLALLVLSSISLSAGGCLGSPSLLCGAEISLLVVHLGNVRDQLVYLLPPGTTVLLCLMSSVLQAIWFHMCCSFLDCFRSIVNPVSVTLSRFEVYVSPFLFTCVHLYPGAGWWEGWRHNIIRCALSHNLLGMIWSFVSIS